MSKIILTTPRLILRHWEARDQEPFIQLNMDPDVMQFFPAIRTKEETLAQIGRIESHFSEHGYGWYAAERRDNSRFIGFIGFKYADFKSFFTPCVEIGWRLSKENWGHGFATEGARACLDFGFKTLGFKEIYSFTSKLNLPSIKVMQKTGMKYAGEFEEPSIEEGHRLKTHVLYQKKAEPGSKPFRS
jgi:ribosomal-protein-alanine N-acetyltransferase